MYLLAFDPSASGAQALFLASGDKGPQLVVRRYKASFSGKSDAQAHYTKYYVWDRRNQIWIPWSDEGIAHLSSQINKSLETMARGVLAVIGEGPWHCEGNTTFGVPSSGFAL